LPMFYISLKQSREVTAPDGTTHWETYFSPKWNGFDNQYNSYFVGRHVTDETTGERRWEWGVIGGELGPATPPSRARWVTEAIKPGLPLSLYLGVMAYMLALVLGIPIGILAAYRQNSAVDY